jgi:hypothetical protein
VETAAADAATAPSFRLPQRTRIEGTVNDFLQTALTFPTVVYSMLLAVSALYWVFASTGLADGDAIDALTGGHGHGHIHVGGDDHVDVGGPLHGDGHGEGDAAGAAAMLSRLGLRGIPLTVSATVFSLMGWLGTYFVHLLALPRVPADLRTLAGTAVMLAMVVPALAATSLLLRPVSRRLATFSAAAEPSLLGRTGVVITPELTSDYGQASFDDGGAGLILQVRSDGAAPLRRGDRIVLIEYLDGQNAYRVISEQQFLGR